MLTFKLRLERGDGDLPLGLLRTTCSARQSASATYCSLTASNNHDRGAKTRTVLPRVSSGRGTWREHAHVLCIRVTYGVFYKERPGKMSAQEDE